MTVYIAGDHFAEPALAVIRARLGMDGLDYREFGYRAGENPETKLTKFIRQTVNAVRADSRGTGILVCGSGTSVEIGANRFAGIRASLCTTPQAAEWARKFDDANVLCLASWLLPDLDIGGILSRWFNTTFDVDMAWLETSAVFDSWAESPDFRYAYQQPRTDGRRWGSEVILDALTSDVPRAGD